MLEDVKIANYPFQLFHFSIVYKKGKFGKNLWNIYNPNPN